jgi:hypothetical protein
LKSFVFVLVLVFWFIEIEVFSLVVRRDCRKKKKKKVLMVVLRIGDLVSSFKQHFSLRDGGCGCCEEEVEFV